MSQTPLDEYFQTNAAAYDRLVGALLGEIESLSGQKPTPELTAARRDYLLTAIAKGTDFTTIPAKVPTMGIRALRSAADALPDRFGKGWREDRTTSVTPSIRKDFAKAAEKRADTQIWPALFPDGQDTVVLDFGEIQAESIDDKIAAFLAAHNTRAKTLYAEAVQADADAKAQNPAAYPRAGRDISQRTIRIHDRREENDQRIRENEARAANGKKPLPMLPMIIQSRKTGKDGQEIWENGPSFLKYLQDTYEWELFDIVQRGLESRKDSTGKERSEAGSLREIANRSDIAADPLYARDELRIVVSRDPQKVGEMSTGQRWRSCMATDGVNFRFVAEDIKAGSLVAYVVHKDDVAARYPLMRQLLKPFRNEAGETILIPAKPYGASGWGRSQTRDAFKATLNAFVRPVNDGAKGTFIMDKSLYEDRQATTVVMDDTTWTLGTIHQAMEKYKNGAEYEFFTEMARFQDLQGRGEKGPHGEDPADAIKKLKSKIARLYLEDDTDVGLPRMFFRETCKTFQGTRPDPRDIADAAKTPERALRSQGFTALLKGDHATWNRVSGQLSLRDKIDLSAIAFEVAPDPAFAQKIWHETAAPYLPGNPQTPHDMRPLTHRYKGLLPRSYPGDVLRGYDVLFLTPNGYDATKTRDEKFLQAQKMRFLLGGIYGSMPPLLKALSVLLDHVDKIPDAYEICCIAQETMILHNDPAVVQKAVELFKKHIDAAFATTSSDRIKPMLQTVFLMNSRQKLGLYDTLERLMLSVLENTEGTSRAWSEHLFARDVAALSKNHYMSPKLLEKCLSVAVDCASQLDISTSRAMHADNLYLLADDFPTIQQKINNVILNNLPRMPSLYNIADLARIVYERTEDGSPQHAKAKALLGRANVLIRVKKIGVPVNGIRKAITGCENHINRVAGKVAGLASGIRNAFHRIALSKTLEQARDTNQPEAAPRTRTGRSMTP